MRIYPPGTALYLDGKCLCGGLRETKDKYVPYFQSGNEAIPDGFKSKIIEFQPNNRVIGNYGSFVFTENVQMLDLLTTKHENKYLCCNCVKPSPLSNRIRHTNQTKYPNEISELNKELSNNNAVEENIKCPLISLNGPKTVTSKSTTESEIEILFSKNQKNKNNPMANLLISKQNKTHSNIIINLLLLTETEQINDNKPDKRFNNEYN